MSSKKELKLAYGMAIALFVVGAVSYAYTAFSAKPPELPVRIMYPSAAGKVLFDHKTHTADTGYGFSCYDCHHHPEGRRVRLACLRRLSQPAGRNGTTYRNHASNATTRTKSKARKSLKGAMPFIFSASTATKTPVPAPKTVIHAMCCKEYTAVGDSDSPPCYLFCDQTTKGEI